MARNYLAGANTMQFDYCADMRIVDLNNGEQFFMLEVLMLVPEVGYGLFAMNEPVAIDKWMIFLTPERNGGEEEEDIYTEHKTYAFETSMDCTKIPPQTAMVWLQKAMISRKNNLINTSRPLSCYLSNIFYRSAEYMVPLETPN